MPDRLLAAFLAQERIEVGIAQMQPLANTYVFFQLNITAGFEQFLNVIPSGRLYAAPRLDVGPSSLPISPRPMEKMVVRQLRAYVVCPLVLSDVLKEI